MSEVSGQGSQEEEKKTDSLYDELTVSPQLFGVMEKIGAGGTLDLADLPWQEISFGQQVDTFLRRLTSLSLERGKVEFGVMIPVGSGAENKGKLYGRRVLEDYARGTFGKVKLRVPSSEVLKRIRAEIRARVHSHPANPPYHHFDDTWALAYLSDKTTKSLHGGSFEFEWVLTPDQAGVIFATNEARNYVDAHKPISYKIIANKMQRM